jgi:hypothetical protein
MTDLDRFYSLLAELERRPGQGRRLAEYTGKSSWPRRGVYFFREPGEWRSGQPGVPRIVRVGTHAVSANAKSTLWGRLRAHRGDRSGGGNHRGSIFRLHVGAAILLRETIDVATWGRGSSAAKPIRVDEREHERRVSAHVGEMSVIWVDVPDDPGPESARAQIECNAIAMLSNVMNPFDSPSDGWLGHHSPRSEIRRSALWNLNYVDLPHDPSFLGLLESFIERTDIL